MIPSIALPRRAIWALAALAAGCSMLAQPLVAHATSAPSPIPLTSSSCPTDIEEGQISGCVTELQELLNDHNARLTVDGNFGPATLQAVKDFQSSVGIAVDGIVGPVTKSRLLDTSATVPSPVDIDSSSCPADIEEGQVGGCVTEVQDLLNDHGARLVVDGDFGPQTLAAVETFQSAHGLSVDGIVGPETKAALLHAGGAPLQAQNLLSSACPDLIQEGEIDGCVVTLQSLLNAHGQSLAVDGDFGPLTLAAVKSFQASVGLVVDGIVGPETKGALYSNLDGAGGSGAPAPIDLESSACPTDIEEGQISGCVTELQSLLNRHGATLAVDGDFGPLTLAAVKSFQASVGLAVDGIVGPLTKAALYGNIGTGAGGAPAPIDLESSGCPTDIEEGQISGCVTELQLLLNRNGATLSVDGDFGPLTLAAVEAYQSSHGLSVDGIVGPQTKAALYGQVEPVPPPPTGGNGNAAVVAAARRIVDGPPTYPYVWDGGHLAHPGPSRDYSCSTDPDPIACEPKYADEVGFDCSGFVRYVFWEAGFGDIGPYGTASQVHLGSAVGGWSADSYGSEIQPGDLIFFGGTPSDPDHVGIYMGNGLLANAPETGENLTIAPVSDYYPVVAERHIPDPNATEPSSGVKDYSGSGLSTNLDWAQLVLRDGGWPVTANNTTVVMQWMASEHPVDEWWSLGTHDVYNPLDCGLGSGGGSGLGNYPNLHTGAYYVALNLREGLADYGTIDEDLGASAAPATTAQAIWDSPWASSHYGYGSSWHSGGVPTYAAPSSAAW